MSGEEKDDTPYFNATTSIKLMQEICDDVPIARDDAFMTAVDGKIKLAEYKSRPDSWPIYDRDLATSGTESVYFIPPQTPVGSLTKGDIDVLQMHHELSKQIQRVEQERADIIRSVGGLELFDSKSPEFRKQHGQRWDELQRDSVELNTLRNERRFPYQFALQRLSNEIDAGTIAVPQADLSDMDVCKNYHAEKQAGTSQPLNDLLDAKQLEGILAVTKMPQTALNAASRMYVLATDDERGDLRLMFGSAASEQQYSLWPVLVSTYNIKHSENITTAPDGNNSFRLSGARDAHALLDFMNKGLDQLAQVPEHASHMAANTSPEPARSR